MEKQKTGRAEAMMREQRGAMEKELGSMQAKAQGSFQDLQTMQIKVRITLKLPTVALPFTRLYVS